MLGVVGRSLFVMGIGDRVCVCEGAIAVCWGIGDRVLCVVRRLSLFDFEI